MDFSALHLWAALLTTSWLVFELITDKRASAKIPASSGLELATLLSALSVYIMLPQVLIDVAALESVAKALSWTMLVALGLALTLIVVMVIFCFLFDEEGDEEAIKFMYRNGN